MSLMFLAGCDKGSLLDGSDVYYSESGYAEAGRTGGEGGGQDNGLAGKVTAGEWRDLDRWEFWGGLMTGENFQSKSNYWSFYTNNRIAVEVVDAEGNAAAGVPISISRGGKTVWEAVTDHAGKADCWVALYQYDGNVDAAGITLSVGGQAQDGSPAISPWDGDVTLNRVTLAAYKAPARKADIAFIVDATGSMGDEIRFLKDDLLDILKKTSAAQTDVAFRTGALFYRDEGDDYVTKSSDFGSFDKTIAFVKKQSANGGGDYPEAVHTALRHALTDLAWDSDAPYKLAFMLLDAPAHHNDDVIGSLHKSISEFAARGIRLIPIAASGANKDTEFMLRFFAIATGGTYVFITDDSGIGNPHIAASVGEYQVELLNELIIRLIGEYTK